MSGEKNNNEGWRSRLDELSDEPAPEMRDALWTKLQDRSTATGKHKKRGWLWLAACITGLLVLGLTAMFLRKEDVQTARAENHPPMPIKLAVTPVRVEKDTASTAIAIHPSKRTALAAAKKPRVVIAFEQPAYIPPPAEKIINAAPVASAVLPVKKLNVVHLNELESSAIAPQLPSNDSRPYFPLRFSARDVYGSASEHANEAHSLIRIKISP